MVQSTTSLKREERLLQMRHDYKKTRTDRVSGCRAKTAKTSEHSEAWKTPLLNRNFRYSERFKKDDNDLPTLRREKTFDETLLASEREAESPRAIHENKMKAVGDQIKGKLSPLAQTSMPLRKSLPSLLHKNNEEKDEFQAELKKATSRIRNDINSKVNVNKKTSHNDVAARAANPTKPQNKVTESSRTNKNNETKVNSRRPPSRSNEIRPKTNAQNDVKSKAVVNQPKFNGKENGRTMPDRGQASGKESTPEHSPTREKETPKPITSQPASDNQKQAPSKQFYFGMIENKQLEAKDHLKDFPGLGSPIIEEFRDFHLIEQKLLSYHNEDDEIDKFKSQLKEEKKIIKNLSSESALSSEGSEGEGSDGSLGIAVRLRPTLPKKQLSMPRFSPAAAWRQLASLDAHFAAERQPLSLAVETKMSGEVPPESSPRSEQSADKSGDSGISGDHAHSDHRVDSPSRHHPTDTTPAWTPQQDLGDSSSDGAGAVQLHADSPTVATYSPGAQPFSLSLPRDSQDRGKQIQQGFNSLQKFRKSVSGALGAALGSRRFDLEHEPMLEEPEQNWFLTKSAPNSLSNPLLYQQPARATDCEDIKEESVMPSDKEEPTSWRPGTSYLSWGGHVMYLPPAPAAEQPLSMLGPIDRPVRSKSSGCLEAAARAARAARVPSHEMRERDRSASPEVARALPARVEPAATRPTNAGGRSKRFTFQSTVRQLERRRLAEKLSKEADLKEQQRKTEQEAMRRVEEEFQRKRAREKANIRQQLRLVSSGAASMPASTTNNAKTRDEPDGSCRESPAPERTRERQRHSNASSEISGRSKSTTPIRCVELSEWRCEGARVYRDWAAPPAHTHPPACARMPMSAHVICNAAETEAFSGSPRSDNYRLEFARGRSPRTPRAPRLLPVPRSPSTSGSELSLRHPIKIRW
ncbi:hypothetical protein O3G_MSEX004174 [Manduca sexta]|uniref:Uncharacterized protein n=1 Tax=Manduca sexta TaxID=7130 RepID=A0A922CH40_MANSE|nr:hypothetical protein O3G_MSEX004174 [Manduca sexta]KAG6445972.1 hypothetical protein O3G_MSEX004174 [Manduca sexta]